jgi:acyl-CoA synthetase (AMP-forming)/AMP-acid ligase II
MRLEALLQRFAGYADRVAIVVKGEEFSYAQLVSEIELWRARVREAGLEGRAIGYASDFGFDSIALQFACLAEGNVVVLLPTDRDRAGYLKDGCVTDVVGAERGVLAVQAVHGSNTHPTLAALLSQHEPGLVIFSSGSSGRPKAALHSLERFLSKFERPGRAMRTLAFLMYDHIAGQDTLFHTLGSGGTLILVAQRDPDYIVELIKSTRVEVLPTSPSFLRLLFASRDVESSEMPSLRVITFGSEPMDAGTMRQLAERFPDVERIQKYGTTETGSPRTQTRSGDSLWFKFKTGTTQAETRIRDGILWLRSPATLLGYLNADMPLNEDGWYCTGDRVEQDGEWIRVIGRDSEMINVGGEKVSPVEVEDVIRELGFVRDVLVVGEPNGLLGNIVAARVVVDRDESTDPVAIAREIRRYTRSRLARFKVPVKVDLVDQLAVSPRMKRSRQALADQSAS